MNFNVPLPAHLSKSICLHVRNCFVSLPTLKMKGRGESNINVWFPLYIPELKLCSLVIPKTEV
jgi:hypothetical protein